ncbi:transglutaminase domain-containing protein [Microbacterium rhizomatis]|uniref:Transglutaminase domain-containing protein n=1 Tax=Microbacterium rhizomatis TaxID=1631477 RepID=A0A5J5IYD4_9MICO|nr:transglutaminase domain-containing protein [Microbacterium rhizomatis]
MSIAPRRTALDLAATAALLLVGIVGFWPTFGGPGYLFAALGALALGVAIAWLGARFRWGILIVAALTVATYFVFGGALALPHTAIAGVIPSLDTLQQLGLGVVTSWKRLLTTVAPVAASDGHLIVPFLLTLVAAVVTASLALRLRSAGWALIPAAAYLGLQIALGTPQPAVPIIQGVVFAIAGVVWLAVRQAWSSSSGAVSLGGEDSASTGMAVRRVVAGGAILAVAATAGFAAAAIAAPAAPRYVLRDAVIPPFDIKQYASPMQGYRGYVRDDASTTLFTVSGLPVGARVRIATMDAYDGTVYNVSDEGAGSSSAFTPVRASMSAGATGTPATVRVDIGDYDGVWMPEVGAVTNVTFDGARADDLRRSAHYNESTETGVVTSTLQTGDGYTMSAVLPTVPSDTSLANSRFAPVRMPKQEGVPQEFADIAAKAVADANTPIEQARALEQMLSKGGFFSHGLEGEVLSRAGHGAARITTLLGSTQMVGDDEQYATAMALLAGELGMPARVVMGFYPAEDQAQNPVFDATGDNLHAWVEVAFEGAGWVPFDPTPPKDQIPTDQTTKPRADPKPQVLQPPPPEQQPADLPPTVPDERATDDPSPLDLGLLLMWIAIGGGILLLLALLAAPFIVIGAVKAARRRRRRAAERAADQISGGWDELRDRAVDYGTPVRLGATHAEDAAIIATAFGEPRVTTLARRADVDVFGPAEPTASDVDEFWRQVDEIVDGIGERATFRRRLAARLSLRSLLAGTRFSRTLSVLAPVRRSAAAESRSIVKTEEHDD